MSAMAPNIRRMYLLGLTHDVSRCLYDVLISLGMIEIREVLCVWYGVGVSENGGTKNATERRNRANSIFTGQINMT